MRELTKDESDLLNEVTKTSKKMVCIIGLLELLFLLGVGIAYILGDQILVSVLGIFMIRMTLHWLFWANTLQKQLWAVAGAIASKRVNN